jgi:hypothetical protein
MTAPRSDCSSPGLNNQPDNESSKSVCHAPLSVCVFLVSSPCLVIRMKYAYECMLPRMFLTQQGQGTRHSSACGRPRGIERLRTKDVKNFIYLYEIFEPITMAAGGSFVCLAFLHFPAPHRSMYVVVCPDCGLTQTFSLCRIT